ncbi:DUF4442 domain-containing protein [Aquimarina pacifica]|uniref:DUF4442 domain-containing protein n=1 Tax=Aquimarina pacifica TaxID=1296415 RepID=UPI000470485A|nr:DUF4442 domain-containing protein [Aquimarina pacifica]
MKWFLSFVKSQFKNPWFFKYAFNFSPMYRRSVGRIISVSDDLHKVKIKIPINYKNRNYMGAVFGGSLFSATDPILMIQLVQILGKEYVVWDKSASIRYKIPVREKVYANFEFDETEILAIKKCIAENKEMDLTKLILIQNENSKVYAEVTKVIYIADKHYYSEKRKKRKKRD